MMQILHLNILTHYNSQYVQFVYDLYMIIFTNYIYIYTLMRKLKTKIKLKIKLSNPILLLKLLISTIFKNTTKLRFKKMFPFELRN